MRGFGSVSVNGNKYRTEPQKICGSTIVNADPDLVYSKKRAKQCSVSRIRNSELRIRILTIYQRLNRISENDISWCISVVKPEEPQLNRLLEPEP